MVMVPFAIMPSHTTTSHHNFTHNLSHTTHPSSTPTHLLIGLSTKMVMDPSTGLWKQQASSPTTRTLAPSTHPTTTTTSTTTNGYRGNSYGSGQNSGTASGYTGMGYAGLKPTSTTTTSGVGSGSSGYARPVGGSSYAPATTGYHQPGILPSLLPVLIPFTRHSHSLFFPTHSLTLLHLFSLKSPHTLSPSYVYPPPPHLPPLHHTHTPTTPSPTPGVSDALCVLSTHDPISMPCHLTPPSHHINTPTTTTLPPAPHQELVTPSVSVQHMTLLACPVISPHQHQSPFTTNHHPHHPIPSPTPGVSDALCVRGGR